MVQLALVNGECNRVGQGVASGVDRRVVIEPFASYTDGAAEV